MRALSHAILIAIGVAWTAPAEVSIAGPAARPPNRAAAGLNPEQLDRIERLYLQDQGISEPHRLTTKSRARLRKQIRDDFALLDATEQSALLRSVQASDTDDSRAGARKPAFAPARSYRSPLGDDAPTP